MSYQDDLIANYEQLAAERDWSAEQMADHLEPLDKSLAAEFRSRAKVERSAPPKSRRSAGKSEA